MLYIIMMQSKHVVGVSITVLVTLFIVFWLWSQKTCDAGYVKLMLAPGDHCVLDPVSKKCGGHVNDFSDAHHRQECVSKDNFERLWNSGLCHYDDNTPIINKQGYVMCKSDPISEVTIDGISMHINLRRAESLNNWKRIQINGHEILSDYTYVLIKGNDKAIEHLASLPTVNREQFLKHIEWMNSHNTMNWETYCKDIPKICEDY